MLRNSRLKKLPKLPDGIIELDLRCNYLLEKNTPNNTLILLPLSLKRLHCSKTLLKKVIIPSDCTVNHSDYDDYREDQCNQYYHTNEYWENEEESEEDDNNDNEDNEDEV